MKINRKPYSIWFDYHDGARVEIKALTPGEKADINDLAVVQRVVMGPDKKPITSVDVSAKTLRMERAKRAVVNFEGFEDEDGVAIAFTPENVAVLLEFVDGFQEFVAEKLVEVEDAKATHDEEAEKN